MPLAQNYLDDVTLVESRIPPANQATVNCPPTGYHLRGRFPLNIHVSLNGT